MFASWPRMIFITYPFLYVGNTPAVNTMQLADTTPTFDLSLVA